MTSCNRQIDDTFWPKITAFYTIFPPISRLHFFMFFRDSFGFGNLQGIRICTIAIFWILKFRNLSKFRLERANIGKCDNLSIFRPFPHNNVVSRYRRTRERSYEKERKKTNLTRRSINPTTIQAIQAYLPRIDAPPLTKIMAGIIIQPSSPAHVQHVRWFIC